MKQKKVVPGRIELYNFTFQVDPKDARSKFDSKAVIAHIANGTTKLSYWFPTEKARKDIELLQTLYSFEKETPVLESFAKRLGSIIGWEISQEEAQALILAGKFNIKDVPVVVYTETWAKDEKYVQRLKGKPASSKKEPVKKSAGGMAWKK